MRYRRQLARRIELEVVLVAIRAGVTLGCKMA